MDAAAERDLVGRCRAGDEAAFRDLVDAYKDLVFALIARTIPDRNRVEDLAQEVFLRVHRGLPYFRGEARLSTWIYRIAANVCLQDRGSSPVRSVSLDHARENGRALEIPAHDRAFDRVELRDRLEKAIAQLPSTYRLLIAGHYLKGLQYEELAEALEMPLGTVKTQLHRAKRRLREMLEGSHA